MKSSYLIFFFPFFCFVLGYWSMHRYFIAPIITTPTIIGLPLDQGLALLGNMRLNARIINYQERDDISEQTIISQQPAPGQSIKTHCPVLLTVAKKPANVKAPQCIGMDQRKISSIAQKNNIALKSYQISNQTVPAGLCFAQWPMPEKELEKNALICCISSSSDQRLMPNFIGLSFQEAQEFLSKYNVDLGTNLDDESHNAHEYTIVEQYPLAGTVISLEKKLVIQFFMNKLT